MTPVKTNHKKFKLTSLEKNQKVNILKPVHHKKLFIKPLGQALLAVILLGLFLGFMVLRQPSALKAPPIRGSNVTSNSLFYASNQEFSVKIGERNTNKPVIEYSLPGGNKITFAYTNTQGKLIAPVSKGNTVSFTNVAPNIDINYTTLPTGLKEEIVLKKQVPSHIFNFSLNTTNAYPESQTDALYSSIFYDQKGQYLFHFEKPFATDAKGSRTDNVAVQIKRDTKTNAYFLTLDVDRTWFESPDRVYPIIIDPTIVHNTSTVFATGQLNREKDTGSGSSPSLESYYQELPADANTVGLWHMNEASGNVLDSSGNGNTGTPTGSITVTSGILGNARTGFGSSQSINLGSSTLLNPSTAMTIEGWIYPTGTPTGNGEILCHCNGSTDAYQFFITGSTPHILNLSVYNTSGTNYSVSSLAIVPDNQWTHVAGIFNSTTNSIDIYINGQWVNRTITSGTLRQSAINVYMGMHGGSPTAHFYVGKMDEMRLSNIARSPEEIRLDASRRPYSTYTSDVLDLTFVASWNPLKWTANGLATGDGETATTSATSNLVAQWNFNETSGTTAVSGGTCGTACNGTLTNFASTGSQDAAPGTGWTAANKRWGAGALMFDGTNDFVDATTNASLDLTSSLSAEVWFNTSNPNQTTGFIVSKDFSTGNRGWGIKLASNFIFIEKAGTNLLTSKKSIVAGTWYHIVTTFDGSTWNLYINGQLDNSVSGTSVLTNSSAKFMIGARQYVGAEGYFSGTIDSTKIYNRALTASEVLSNYNSSRLELQTRVGATNTPNDGTWEAWKPTTNETQINSLDADSANWKIDQPSTNPESCKDILDRGLSTGDGTYTIQLGGQNVQVYCDMTTNGGGWTLVANIAPADGNSVGYNNQAFWTANAEYGSFANKLSNDYKSPAAYGLPSDQLMIVSANTGSSGSVLGWRQWPLASQTFGSLFKTGIATVHTASCATGASTAVNTGTTSTWDDIIRQGTCLYTDANFSASGIADIMRLSTISYNGTDNNMAGFASCIDCGAEWQGTTSPYMGIDRAPCNSTGCTYATICKMPSDDCLGNNCTAAYASTGGTCSSTWNSRFYVRGKISKLLKSDSTTTKIEGSGSMKIQTGLLQADPATVGLWHLDETGGTGAYLKDSSTNANNGTPTGTSVVDGISGKARSFNGTSDYFTTGSLAGFSTGNTIHTVEAWIKPNAIPTTRQWPLLLGGATTGNLHWLWNSNGTLLYGIWGINSCSVTPTVGVWNYFATTYDGTTGRCYLNGNLISSFTGSSFNFTATTLAVAQVQIGEAAFNGSIDELRISNIARSPEEIAEDYRMGRDHRVSETISSTNLSSATKLPFYVASDRLGTFSQLTIGNSAFANYEPDANTVGLWHLDDAQPGFATSVYTCTGAAQTYTVPAGVTTVRAKIWGAGGGGGYAGGWALGFAGGGGGYVTGDITVSPGQVLNIVAGCGGINGSASLGVASAWPNGGLACISSSDCRYGGGGGGFSGIYNASSVYYLMAGAGGGGGSSRAANGQQGGAGGGDLGANGSSYTTASGGGGGDTWSGGGAGGTGTYAGTAGGSQAGGHNGVNSYGGGGGSGWYGGGGGGYLEPNDMGGGGGGSSYFANGAAIGVTNASTVGGSGVTQGNSTDSDNGGYGAGGGVNVAGTSGKVVISVPNQTKDSSGNGNNGYLAGTTPTQGKLGKARSFNGTSDYVSIGNLGSFPTQGTLGFWINSTEMANYRNPLTTKFSGGNSGIRFEENATGNFGALIGNDVGTANTCQYINSGMLTNTWYYVVYTWNTASNVGYGYLNGQLVCGGTQTYWPTTIPDLRFGTGYSTDAARQWKGLIDEVRIDNVARSADDIRQAYEIGARTHNITIDFKAKLNSGNLISDTSDLGFTVDETAYGSSAMASHLFLGDKVIVEENYNGTNYVAQGTVNSVNSATGAVTVTSWDSGSTVPSGGYTVNATVFKWQREYFDVTNSLSTQRNAITRLTYRITDGSMGANIWLDDLRSSTGYLTDPFGSSPITSSLGDRYFQYRAILSQNDLSAPSAGLTSVTLDYTHNEAPNIPTLDSPTDTLVGVPLLAVLKTTAIDNNSDTLKYKINLCTNSGMSVGCQVFDQTASQTGWSGQDASSSSAYASGTQAIYTVQTPLAPATTYYWKSLAIDPAGSNTWSATQVTPYSFTTSYVPVTVTLSTPTNGSTDITLTPTFTMSTVDTDSDYLRYKLKICNEVSMAQFCQVFDQTTSQTGWSGQNASASSAYASGSTATFVDTVVLTAGKIYYWQAFAIDPAGSNTWSPAPTPFSLTTKASSTMPAPCSTARATDNSSVTINWTDNSTNEDDYQVWKSTDGGLPVQLGSDLAANTIQLVDSAVSPNHSYGYLIRTVRYDGANAIYSDWCSTNVSHLPSSLNSLLIN